MHTLVSCTLDHLLLIAMSKIIHYTCQSCIKYSFVFLLFISFFNNTIYESEHAVTMPLHNMKTAVITVMPWQVWENDLANYTFTSAHP